MKKNIVVFMACTLLFLPACSSGISQSEYDAVVSENLSLKTKLESLSDSQNFVIDENMTLTFAFGDRKGIYTGMINSDGNPDGFGKFQNSADNPWVYYGEWKDGHFNGHGITQWTDYSHMGLYETDYMEDVGMYYFIDGSVFCGEFEKSKPVKSYIPNTENNNNLTQLESSLSESIAGSNNTNPSSKFDIGTYKVGKTISAGEYVLINNNTSDQSRAELEIDTDSLGQFSSIGLLMETNSFAYFLLQDNEYLVIEKGQVILIDDFVRPKLTSYQSIPCGMYIVGEDIPSGEYELKATNDKKAHYTIYKEIPSSKDAIVYSLDYFDVNTFITLKEGDYILYLDSEMSLISSE